MSTLRKSVTTIAEAWARRNAFQLSRERKGAGPIRFRRSNLRIAVAETTWPSLSSSAWMRTQPHFGLSLAISRIRCWSWRIETWSTRTSPVAEGRPLSAHQLAMPAEDRLGLDQHPDPCCPAPRSST